MLKEGNVLLFICIVIDPFTFVLNNMMQSLLFDRTYNDYKLQIHWNTEVHMSWGEDDDLHLFKRDVPEASANSAATAEVSRC